MRARRTLLRALLLLFAAHTVPGAVLAAEAGDDVEFRVRVCQGANDLKFWFNAEAEQRWNHCEHPIVGVPVFLVTDSQKTIEGKTGQDGIAKLAAVHLSPREQFRMSVACTTHRCLTLQGLRVGGFAKTGANVLFMETVPVGATTPEAGHE